ENLGAHQKEQTPEPKEQARNPRRRQVTANLRRQEIGYVSNDEGRQQAPEVNTLSEGRGAISLKFKKDTYSAIEVLFVVSCLPSAQHRFKLLVGISERSRASRVECVVSTLNFAV